MAISLPSESIVTEKTALYAFTHKLPFFCTSCFSIVKPIQIFTVVFVQNAKSFHIFPETEHSIKDLFRCKATETHRHTVLFLLHPFPDFFAGFISRMLSAASS